jgi:hypothetical protein
VIHGLFRIESQSFFCKDAAERLEVIPKPKNSVQGERDERFIAQAPTISSLPEKILEKERSKIMTFSSRYLGYCTQDEHFSAIEIRLLHENSQVFLISPWKNYKCKM